MPPCPLYLGHRMIRFIVAEGYSRPGALSVTASVSNYKSPPTTPIALSLRSPRVLHTKTRAATDLRPGRLWVASQLRA
jgi:hypothetical protein